MPYTVRSDNQVIGVDLEQLKLPATYEYYAVPKLNPEVYLTAYLTDWESLNLLEGEATVFFEGSYVGKSVLNTQTAGIIAVLSLGRD
jgi:hypothetical protein